MATNIVNVDPYLRTHWHFTQDAQLMTELSRSLAEVAIVTNMREIGTYANGLPAITGKQYFLGGSNRQQQSLRQLVTFPVTGGTTFPLSIKHNIQNLSKTGGLIQGYGSATDTASGNYYGIIYGSSTAIAAQYSFYVTQTQIVILQGAAAPTITSGTIIIEWISQT